MFWVITCRIIHKIYEIHINKAKKTPPPICLNELLINKASNIIKIGPSYKTIYKDFVGQTTLDLSSLIKKWEKTGALKTLLELDK